MGNGMLLVAEESQVDDVLAVAKSLNYEAQVAGVITADNKVTLKTKSAELCSE